MDQIPFGALANFNPFSWLSVLSNVLFDKYLLRYVHGFRQKDRNSGKDLESGDVEGKYLRIYEEGINPFKEFQVKGIALASQPLCNPSYHTIKCIAIFCTGPTKGEAEAEARVC